MTLMLLMLELVPDSAYLAADTRVFSSQLLSERLLYPILLFLDHE
jgi:hypothetical protein